MTPAMAAVSRLGGSPPCRVAVVQRVGDLGLARQTVQHLLEQARADLVPERGEAGAVDGGDLEQVVPALGLDRADHLAGFGLEDGRLHLAAHLGAAERADVAAPKARGL